MVETKGRICQHEDISSDRWNDLKFDGVIRIIRVEDNFEAEADPEPNIPTAFLKMETKNDF